MVEYSEQLAQYREMVDRTNKSAGRAVEDDFDPEINMIEGSNVFELEEKATSAVDTFVPDAEAQAM